MAQERRQTDHTEKLAQARASRSGITPNDVSGRPTRSVLWIEGDAVWSGWRVVVPASHRHLIRETNDEQFVALSTNVREKFTQANKGWQPLFEGYHLAEICLALAGLKQTVCLTVKESQNVTAKHTTFFERQQRVRVDALAVYNSSREFLESYRGRSVPTASAAEKIRNLESLLIAATQTLLDFPNLEPPPRQKSWHMDAILLALHCRRVIREAGYNAVVGDDYNGPLVRLVLSLMKMSDVRGGATENAISKVLQRQVKMASLSIEQIALRGCVIIC